MQEPKNASEVLHLRNNSTKTVFLPLLLSDRNEKKKKQQAKNEFNVVFSYILSLERISRQIGK